jgi:hypothetical protein
MVGVLPYPSGTPFRALCPVPYRKRRQNAKSKPRKPMDLGAQVRPRTGRWRTAQTSTTKTEHLAGAPRWSLRSHRKGPPSEGGLPHPRAAPFGSQDSANPFRIRTD